MDPLRSFSDYDLLAHIPHGMLAFAAWDMAFGSSFILNQQNWSFGAVALVLIMSYAVGHMIAGLSHFALEKGLARGVLGSTSSNLLADTSPKGVLKWIFPEYKSPAGYPVRTAVRARLAIANLNEENAESAFWTAYGATRSDEYTRTRIKTFLNLYGFCRNLAFLGFLSALLFFFVAAINFSPKDFWAAPNIGMILAIALGSFLMLQRYLKFYRLYALEIFVAYANQRS